MDCSQYKSVVTLVERLARFEDAGRSRVRGPASSTPHTEFSIRSILDLEKDSTDIASSSGELQLF